MDLIYRGTRDTFSFQYALRWVGPFNRVICKWPILGLYASIRNAHALLYPSFVIVAIGIEELTSLFAQIAESFSEAIFLVSEKEDVFAQGFKFRPELVLNDEGSALFGDFALLNREDDLIQLGGSLHEISLDDSWFFDIEGCHIAVSKILIILIYTRRANVGIAAIILGGHFDFQSVFFMNHFLLLRLETKTSRTIIQEHVHSRSNRCHILLFRGPTIYYDFQSQPMQNVG